MNTDPVLRPRDFEPGVLVGLGAGLHLANLAGSNASAEAHSFPWVGGLVEAGGALTYREWVRAGRARIMGLERLPARDRQPAQFDLPHKQVPLEERALDTLTTLHTRQHQVAIRLWDNAEIDGDTISVLPNGVPVLSAHKLTRKPVRLALDLDRGSNDLVVIAHNEGSVPPHTASATVRWGKGKKELLIRASLKSNQVVLIDRE